MPGVGQPRRGAALVVGVGRYPHADIAQLQFAAADAEAIADLLGDPDVCDFPPTHIATLLDEDASRDKIVEHLTRWLPEKARGADVVVLYFAGHGTVCKVGDRAEGYFLSHDADPDNPMARGVAMGDVARYMDGLDAAAVVLCLDCCHAGQVMRRDATARDMAIRPANLQPLAGKGRYLLASCDEGQSSVEVPALGHGLFTHHLLHGLCGGGDLDGDGKVGVEELFRYVAQAVEADAKEHRVSQRPWMSLVAATGTYLAEPRKAAGPAPGSGPFGGAERVRVGEGPAAAVREIEARMTGADEATLVPFLKQLGRLADPAAVPALFRSLGHEAAAVRRQAKLGIQAVGVERSFQAIVELAKKPDEAVLGPVLDGLNAYDADPRLVALLNRLVDLLDGKLLLTANEVLEQKKLSVGLETMAALFREKGTGYGLTRVLGHGLFAAAYKAVDEFSGHKVVVRVLRAEFAQQAHIRKQFLELSRRSIRLVHHNLLVTRTGGTLPDRGIYFVVRDYISHHHPLLRDMIKGGCRFAAAAAVAVLRQILAALDVVHAAGLCHGGVKPSNVFVCAPNHHVVLGDLSPPPQGVGSAVADRLAYDYRYAAPEVLQMTPPGPPADVYALGCVAFEMLTGEPPYAGDNYMAVSIKHLTQPPPRVTPHRPDLPPAADIVIAGLMAKAPGDRPAGAAVLALVERLLEAPPKAAPPAAVPAAKPLASYRPIVSAMSIGLSRPLVSMADASLPPEAPARTDDFDSEYKTAPPLPPPPTASDSEFELSLDDSGSIVRPPDSDGVEEAKGDIFATDFSLPPVDTGDSSGGGVAIHDAEPAAATGSGFPGHSLTVQPDSPPAAEPHPTNPGTQAQDGPPAVLAPMAVPPELANHPSYTDVRLIGRGGMGTVYLARNTFMDRLEVLKVMQHFDSARAAERFLREIRATAQLQHPNIVVAYTSFKLGEQFVLAMEYVKGSDLTALVRQQGPLPVRQACHYVRQAALGLQHAHEAGMVHRDIKPSNLMVTSDGRRTVLKILDFGLARLHSAAEAEVTAVGTVLGTPHFMAPEQARNAASVDTRADIYSLGATLFFLLTGRPPFEGESPLDVLVRLATETPPAVHSVRSDVPLGLSAVVAQMLAKNPTDRYQTPRDVVAALAPFLGRDDDPPSAAAPPALPPDEGVWKKVRRWFS